MYQDGNWKRLQDRGDVTEERGVTYGRKKEETDWQMEAGNAEVSLESDLESGPDQYIGVGGICVSRTVGAGESKY